MPWQAFKNQTHPYWLTQTNKRGPPIQKPPFMAITNSSCASPQAQFVFLRGAIDQLH